MILDKAYLALGSLPVGAAGESSENWDVGTFLENAQTTIHEWGNLLLLLLGTIMMVWAGVLIFKKLTATQQTEGQQAGWFKIALLLLIGGALMAVGFSIMADLGSGGATSIGELGKGSMLLGSNLRF